MSSLIYDDPEATPSCTRGGRRGQARLYRKPLATTVADGAKIISAAKAKGLSIGAAPDTVLGASIQEARV